MQLILIVIGAIVGMWLGDGSDEVMGLVAGAAIGYLLSQVFALRERLGALDKRLSRLASEQKKATASPLGAPQSRWAPQPAAGETPSVSPQGRQRPAQRAVGREPARPVERLRDADWSPGSIARLLAAARGWLTTGNVPVKLGVIVSFFGVAFLLKYAVDKNILVLSIEMRLLAVAVLAAVLLGIGWRLRSRARVYALSLQGGGIGMLYLTIFAALRLYHLLPAPVAFVLLVLLTAATGFLAVVQEAKALAVLGSVGGFLALAIVSTGSGNHVVLFSYYLVLNSAVLGIAWYRAWRILNLIGFGFTFVVGTLWGYQYYRPQLYASTEPFLILYFLFYQAIAVLYAFRQPPKLRGLVDGTIIFGTPVIAFALQAQLLRDTDYGLAISAVAVAAFYLGVATWLRRVHGESMRLLGESFVALGIAFATIAIPLALDDRWTAAAWSLEGAALVWVGVRQHGTLAKLSGSVLLVAGGVAYLQYGWRQGLGMPVINGNVLSGLMVSLASLFSARYLAADPQPRRWQALASVPLMLWGLAWWLGIGVVEIEDRVVTRYELHCATIFIALSAALFARVAQRYQWTAAQRTTLAYLPALPVIAILYLLDHEHFFAGIGTLAWLLAFASHFYLLWALANDRSKLASAWHYCGALLLAAVLAQEVYWRIDQTSFSDTWVSSGALLVPASLPLVVLLLRDRLAWPLQRNWSAYLLAAGTLVAMQLFVIGGLGIAWPGDPAPLPYIPLFNPFDVLTIVGLAIGLQLLASGRATTDWFGTVELRIAAIVWSFAAFVLTTIGVVRGVHHLAGVRWDDDALMRSVSVQAALSIYWGLLAFSGMIGGARHTSRWVWIGGTGLMGLVVVKLFLVDLGNTGTVARIISFLGVGALLLVVGYFAPAPPRQSLPADSEATAQGS